jgi:hypothetical protein
MSDVWYEIREAENFEDINWPAHGLNRAPASPEAQQFLAMHWDELRREERFSDIEWDKYGDDRSGRKNRAERYGRLETGFPANESANLSPFTREESAAMSRAWGQIRETARFEDINWRAMGLKGAPGDREARRLTEKHWSELRKAAQFEDINWQATTGYRAP